MTSNAKLMAASRRDNISLVVACFEIADDCACCVFPAFGPQGRYRSIQIHRRPRRSRWPIGFCMDIPLDRIRLGPITRSTRKDHRAGPTPRKKLDVEASFPSGNINRSPSAIEHARWSAADFVQIENIADALDAWQGHNLIFDANSALQIARPWFRVRNSDRLPHFPLRVARAICN